MTITDLARPEIRNLTPYQAAQQIEDTVRLNANEAPWASVADEFRRPLNRYPEIRPVRLRSALAERFGCQDNQLLVTRGTSEAIDLLMRAFCRPGIDSILTIAPTFSMYGHYATIQGASMTRVHADPRKNFEFDVAELIAACNESTRLIFICTPNNPTGTSVSRDTIEAILSQCAGRQIVVVDEAYIEFSGNGSTSELLQTYDNLVVMRTLSKALAFAGARCGAVMGAAELIGLLDAIQAPYALATPVVECVENALQTERLREAEGQINRIIAERERLTNELQAFDQVRHIWPSDANFFLMQVGDASVVLEQTKADQVLLRHFGGELTDCIRVSVGTVDENNRLLESLAKLK